MKLSAIFRKKWEWFAFAALLLFFGLIKFPTFDAYFADGWIYFYFGKLVSEGALPYLDFYYSSPPFLPCFAGLLHTLFGFNLPLAAALPTVFSAIDALLIFLLLRKKTSNFASLLAVAVYLFSFATLATTKFYSEAHPLTTFALAGSLLFFHKKYFWAGTFFGLAGLTKLYGLVPAVFLPILISKKPRELAKFFGGIFLSFGIPNLIFLFLVGREYLDFIFFNHLGKEAGIPKGRIFKFFLAHDWGLPAVAALALLAKKKKKLILALLPLAALVVFYAIFPDIYYLYLKIFVALFAALLAFVFAGKFIFQKKTVAGIGIALLLASGATATNFYLRSYAPVSRIDDLAGIVEKVSMEADPDQPIYGNFAITPLVALLSEREIFRNYVDTNSKFIDLGLIDLEQRAAEIEAARVPVVITKIFIDPKTSQTLGIEDVLPDEFFQTNCEPAGFFPIAADFEANWVVVWRCGYSNPSK